MIPLQDLACSTCGRTVERAAVKCSRVLCSVSPACSMGMATNSTLPRYFLSAAMRRDHFSVFSVSLLLQPRSLQNLITSTRMRVHCFLLTLLCSHAFGMNEIRRSSVPFREEILGLFRREYPWGYPGGGFCVLRIVIGGGEAQIGVSRVLGYVDVPYAAGLLHIWECL